ncbi:FIST C-terminal domain-containing protein [Candidatus Methylacidiphilum infernorum]|uniref:FIST C-terminal domain-containing protein n=1 Tax=Candidatus Methylacidiphilum infernorum TaxID=511746 RepID=A0ABX7PXD9_9BACT|nr:FIST N-terminal domain-containing protein [Candidatus Methylacidiphilum infernorum]QSR87333.1 FIST C-terminal domain-containing protein [Candidatus Methylacidiphilum infernorum]
MHAVSSIYNGPLEEKRIIQMVSKLRMELPGEPTIGFAFIWSGYLDFASDSLAELSDLLTIYGHLQQLVVVSSSGVVGQGIENEGTASFSLLLIHNPELKCHGLEIPLHVIDSLDQQENWHSLIPFDVNDIKGFCVFADPINFPIEKFLKYLTQAYPHIPAWGGVTSGKENECSLYYNRRPLTGGLLLTFAGNITLDVIVSQACRPIGDPYTITHVDQNILYTLGRKTAYQALAKAFDSLTEQEKLTVQGHLFIGLAVSEYLEEFKQGDFLIRNILGADPSTGAIVIGAFPRVGQTVQYQLRDPQAAILSLQKALEEEKLKFNAQGKIPSAALQAICTGRGKNLFGTSSHIDAQSIQKFFPGIAQAGFFAHGEVGPSCGMNFLHGYSTSIAFLI